LKIEYEAVGREGEGVRGRKKEKIKSFPISQMGTEVMDFLDKHPPPSISTVTAGNPQ